MTSMFGYGASGASPPARPKDPGALTGPDVLAPADETGRPPHDLRERMRAALVQSFLRRDCRATRYDEERTLVTRHRSRGRK
jgi:hypothetical protein